MANIGQVCFSFSSSESQTYAWNIYTGSILKIYKNNSTSKHGSSFVTDSNGNFNGFLSLQTVSKIINLFSFSKELPVQKFILNQKFTSLDVAKNNVLACGTMEGQIMIWDLRSGSLLSSFSAHFSSISVLKFTCDGKALISGSNDGSVHIFFLSRIFSIQPDSGLFSSNADTKISPQIYWTDHNSLITDIFITNDNMERCKVLTCSSDSYCRLYSLYSDKLICSFKLPSAATCCIMDSMESLVLVGGSDGKIYAFEINAIRSGISDGKTSVADSLNGCRILADGHSVSITSIALSPDELIVISGSENGSICCWDKSSFMLIRQLNFFSGPVMLSCLLLPVNLNTFRDSLTNNAIALLKRNIEEEDRKKMHLQKEPICPVLIEEGMQKNSLLQAKYAQLQNDHKNLTAMYDELYCIVENSK